MKFFDRWHKTDRTNGILIMGHSFVRGVQAADPETGGWTALLDAQLKSGYGNGGGGFYGVPASGQTLSANFGKITFGGTWSTNNVGGPFANVAYATGSGRTASLTVEGDTLDVLYLDYSYSSVFTISVDSGNAENYGSNQGYQDYIVAAKVATIPLGSSGNHDIVLTTTNNYFYLIGFVARNAVNGSTTIYRMGIDGGGPGNFAQPTNAWNVAFIDQLAPQLTIMQFGINDWTAQLALTTYRDYLDILIQQARKWGQVLLINDVHFNQVNRAIPMKAYNDWMCGLALKYDCVYLDMAARWGTIEEGVAAGFQTATDNGHPTDLGHQDIADAVYDVLINADDGITVNNVGLVWGSIR